MVAVETRRVASVVRPPLRVPGLPRSVVPAPRPVHGPASVADGGRRVTRQTVASRGPRKNRDLLRDQTETMTPTNTESRPFGVLYRTSPSRLRPVPDLHFSHLKPETCKSRERPLQTIHRLSHVLYPLYRDPKEVNRGDPGG